MLEERAEGQGPLGDGGEVGAELLEDRDGMGDGDGEVVEEAEKGGDVEGEGEEEGEEGNF